MSDQPEPLAAILAEMKRRADEANNGLNGVADVDQIDYMEVEDWVSRIEAAVKRERDEDRQLAAIAESDEAFARCARCDRPERAPGNAAALRHALGIVYDWILKAGNVHGYPDTEQKRRQLYDMMTKALSAPPRNCDRFATVKDAGIAFARECKDQPLPCPDFTFSAWLFAPAEGGAE